MAHRLGVGRGLLDGGEQKVGEKRHSPILWGCGIGGPIRGWLVVTLPKGPRNMQHKRTITSVGAALALAVTPVAALAAEQGAPPAKTATPLGSVSVAKKSATLKVRYSCKSGSTLWISLKQTKSGKKSAKLKKEGSSKA